VVACLLGDNFRGDVFLGKGRVTIEAEQAARASCARNSSASYCSSEVRCSDIRESQPSICVIKDSFRGDSFKGEGESVLEAEFNARRACSSNSSASYCSQKVTCQSY